MEATAAVAMRQFPPVIFRSGNFAPDLRGTLIEPRCKRYALLSYALPSNVLLGDSRAVLRRAWRFFSLHRLALMVAVFE